MSSEQGLAFDPTEEQQMLVEAVNRFASRTLRSAARECNERGDVPAGLIRQGWELGLVAGNVPESEGGLGTEHSALTGALYAEELAWGDLALAAHLLAPAQAAIPILLCGTPEQKRTWLPRLCGPQFVPAAAALVEPRLDFDPFALTTTATPDDGHYVLDGHKCFVPLAADAEVLLVYAADTRTNSTQAFIVERGAPGLVVREREKNMGLRSLATYEVTLESCRLPVANRLGGAAGCGFARLLDHARVAGNALAIGLARAAYEYAREYAKTRVAFGEPIARRQAIAFMLAEMAIEIDAARLMNWEAAWKLDRGEDATREAALAKIQAEATALRATDGAVQILGGHGYIRDHPVEMWLRNARASAAIAGLAMV